VKNNEQAVHT